jgi:hypothetical protein
MTKLPAIQRVRIMRNQHTFKGPLSKSRRKIWIGAASFEDRCLGGICALRENELQLDQAFIIIYGPAPNERRGTEARRVSNRAHLTQHLAPLLSNGPISEISLSAYSYSAMERQCAQWFAIENTDIYIDVTCLTRIHTIALAASISRCAGAHRLFVQYTIPENYSGIPRHETRDAGWKDILVSPFSDYSRFFNEGSSRGILLLGHEADRVVIALAEIEPAGGVIISPFTRQRPDLRVESRRRNARIVQQLLTMRSAQWRSEDVEIMDMDALHASVRREVHQATSAHAPVILFPFGPKCLLLSCALQLAAEYYENAWFVYPIPSSYDPFYTEGIGRSFLFEVRRQTDPLPASGFTLQLTRCNFQ